MLLNAPTADASSHDRFDGTTFPLPPAVMLPPPRHRPTVEATHPAVEIHPSDAVRRRIVTTDGMTVEVMQAARREKMEFRFRAPFHLLAVYDQSARSDGDTYVEGLPRSTLRDVRGKLTFAPAGHEYCECQEPRVLTRIMYVYFNPARMPPHPGMGGEPASLAPRLFFEDATLSDTALKLKNLIESGGPDSSPYFEALGSVLAHELVRLNAGGPRLKTLEQGGLAAWQRRAVVAYIEEHLAEQVSLATLAQLADLSQYHFCRTFKQSFGMPPHRYHNSRRIEHAKTLLAKPVSSVTSLGFSVGFS